MDIVVQNRRFETNSQLLWDTEHRPATQRHCPALPCLRRNNEP